ncbi:DUF1330 domain-containing protein [SAR202 cluster bacterium AD-804-J14_MRT_500m]|nr:DUF1330 domain-containing protein [SAR202 cluster bacterium AD-804-J14_MRT_500m]
MAAYAIADIQITDPIKFEEYRAQVETTIAKFNGRYLVRGGSPEKIEGDWNPTRIVVLEFPTLDLAKKWYHSESYRGPKEIRWQSADSNVIFATGV